MDVASSKRAPIPKKGSGIQLRDGNMTPRFCNRLGCQGRLNHTKVPTNAHTSKNVHSSSGKTIVGSSMKTSSRKEASEASSSQSKPDKPELCSAETIQAQSNNSSSRKIRIGKVVGSPSVSPHKVSRQRSGQSNQANSSGLSASLASKSSLSSRESLRNASTPNTNLTRNKDIAKRQNPSPIEYKIPLGGKKVSRPTTVGGRGSVRVPSNGITISDSSRHQPWSRSNSNNRSSTIPSRIPVPRLSSRSNYSSCTSRPLLGDSSSRTARSPPSIGREVSWAVENLAQDEGVNHQERYYQGGRNFYDQYRDMRLDIDNMSYEELLALGERIGNVSTGIGEEHKWKYIGKTIYHGPSIPGTTVDEYDITCSICQEVYMVGDEAGILNCNHIYHFTCIDEWLRRNKWCPICKVEAVPFPSTSSM